MAAAPNAPWTEHRMIAEALGQAACDAISNAVGTNVELGIASSCEPADMLNGRPAPIRAIVVRFERPLRDVMVFISSLKDEMVRPLVEVAAAAALASIDIPNGDDAHGSFGRFTIEPGEEFETTEEALEQCDALFLEAHYSMEMPTGELQLVIGTGMLESASCFRNGVADPFAEGPRYALAGAEPDDGSLVLGDQIEIDDPARYALSDGDMGPSEAAMLTTDPAGSVPAAEAPAFGAAAPEGLEALDAMLAQQEHAERAAAEALAASRPRGGASLAHAALENAAAAIELPSLTEDASTRWTNLLSGVEVEVSAELGRTDLALGDIASLVTDSVLTLDQMVTEPVDVFVNGTRYATARLVVVDGEYGIEILEVVDQSQIATPLAA